jgi:hypothetical protein
MTVEILGEAKADLLGEPETTRTPTFFRWAGGTSASMLNPSARVFARLSIRASSSNGSGTTVGVSVEGVGVTVTLGPSDFPLELFGVSPNRVWIVGSSSGLVAFGVATP